MNGFVGIICCLFWVLACHLVRARELGDALDVEILDQEIHNERRLTALHGEEQFTYRISAFDQDYDLDLKLHTRYLETPVTFHEVGRGGKVKSTSRTFDCIYSGKVVGEEKSEVLLSLCDGKLHGSIVVGDRSLNLRPLIEDRRLTGVYLHDKEKKHANSRCGLEDHSNLRNLRDYESNLSVQNAVSSSPRKLSTAYIEVLTVVDNVLYNQFERLSFLTALILFEKVRVKYESFPGSNEIELQLVGIIVYTEEDPWLYSGSCVASSCKYNLESELLSERCCVESGSGDGIRVDTSIGLLQQFRGWGNVARSNFLNAAGNTLNYDVAHLLSGYDFYGSSGEGVVGLASVGVACSSNGGAEFGVTQFTSTDYDFVATVWAHENGHNLGFQHADITFGPVTSPCGSNFIMSSTLGGNTDSWSTCSQTYWDDYRTTSCQASEISTTTNNIASDGYCGNGVLDEGEQCDCGLSDCTNIDPCCDGSSCNYTDTAVCAGNDGCCDLDTCTVKNAGEVCRSARHPDCDIAEVCDGVSKACSDDIFNATGTVCTPSEGSAYDGSCFKGNCVSAYDSCPGSYLPCPSQAFLTSCTSVGCVPLTGSCPADAVVSEGMRNGGPCPGDSTRACFKFGTADEDPECVLFEDIPITTNCTNLQLDDGETDVDCGGSCPGCVAGKKCNDDSDCLGTRKCQESNETIGKVCTDPVDAPPDPFGDLLDLWDQILQWIKDNPIIAGVIGAVLGISLIFCLLSCCASGAKGSRKGARKRANNVPQAVPL